MSDDNLRFGNVSGGSSSGTDIGDLLQQALTAIVGLYVLLKVIEILFNIPIPLI